LLQPSCAAAPGRKSTKTIQAPRPSAEDLVRHARIQALERDLQLTDRLLAALEQQQPLNCTAQEAPPLAGRLAQMVTRFLADVAEAEAEAREIAEEPEPLTTEPAQAAYLAEIRKQNQVWEAEELQGLQALIARLGTAVQRYQDAAWITPGLTGERRLGAVDRRRLVALLRHWRGNGQLSLEAQRCQERRRLGWTASGRGS